MLSEGRVGVENVYSLKEGIVGIYFISRTLIDPGV